MFFSDSTLSAEAFLQQYWQRKVCFFPAAKNARFNGPISADELAGLALEDEIESRLVSYHNDEWHLHHGPFTEDDYNRPHPWTLLVQGVDQLLPDIDALWQWVDFIPHWRRDDIMVSYASKGGGVGPHFDRYDVFLVQGAGSRTWHIGQHCDENTALRADSDLCLLSDFQHQQSFQCKPGDVLYIPPGVAHWGIADDNHCMTYSLGFRAPAISDLLSRCFEQALSQLSSQTLLNDSHRNRIAPQGEISADDLNNAKRQLMQVMADVISTPQWFGEAVTQSHLSIDDTKTEASVEQVLLNPDNRVLIDPEARLSWYVDGEILWVFSNGYTIVSHPQAQSLLSELLYQQQLCSQSLTTALCDERFNDLLNELINTRSVYVVTGEQH